MLAYDGRGRSGGILGHPPIHFSTRATSSFQRHTPKTLARKWQIWREWAEIGHTREGRGRDARPWSTPHTDEWPCSVPRVPPLTGKPIAACVLLPWPTHPPYRAMGKANFPGGKEPPISGH